MQNINLTFCFKPTYPQWKCQPWQSITASRICVLFDVQRLTCETVPCIWKVVATANRIQQNRLKCISTLLETLMHFTDNFLNYKLRFSRKFWTHCRLRLLRKNPQRGCQVQYPVLVPRTAGCNKVTVIYKQNSNRREGIGMEMESNNVCG